MTELRILPPAAKYLKKLKDSHLKKLFQNTIDEILENPLIGEEKKGDLRGIRCCDIYYNRINYELVYTIEYILNKESGETDIVIVIMAGTRENFYQQLKQYWN